MNFRAKWQTGMIGTKRAARIVAVVPINLIRRLVEIPDDAKHPRKRSRAFRVLRWVGILIVCSLVWTVFLPGIVAYYGDVFYTEGMVKRLPSKARTDYETYASEQESLKKTTKHIADQTVKLAAGTNFASGVQSNVTQDELTTLKILLDIHTHLENDFKGNPPPIVLAPFFLNPQLWLWPAIYFCLGFIAIVLQPAEHLYGERRKISMLNWLLLGITIYVLYEWPLWMRNFVFGSHGRTLFAFTNYDIHPASFIMQELVILGFCQLLAIIWLQWYLLPSNVDVLIAVNSIKKTFNSYVLNHLSDLLFRWQYTSIVLGIGFGFFSNFFWRIVFQYHDQRYVISGITAHLLWAITWIAISLPLIVRWQRWELIRWKAIVEVESDATLESEEKEARVKSLREIHPGGFGMLLGSAIVAACSFVWPLLKEII